MEEEINQTERGTGEKQNNDKERKEYKVLRKAKHKKMKPERRPKKAVPLKKSDMVSCLHLSRSRKPVIHQLSS